MGHISWNCPEIDMVILDPVASSYFPECVYKAWSSWGVCSTTCGLGTRKRKREVADVLHARGLVCEDLDETMDCVNPACPGGLYCIPL